MTRIFVDARLVTGPADLAEPLRHLTAAGYELVVFDADDGQPEGGSDHDGLSTVADLAPEPGGWYLAADPELCSRALQLGLRSVLVGPNRTQSGLPKRCDRTARDLVDAALTILADEAMPPA